MRTEIVAIIQARMGSKRLPGKTMIPIQGKPLIKHIVERVKQSMLVNQVVVATTDEAADNQLVSYLQTENISVIRGSKDDVLDRFYKAAQAFQAQIIVRVTADDPFKDPDVIDRAIKIFQSEPELDYVSNTLEPSYPEGLDIEVFSFKALQRAWNEAKLPSEREHVTPYIWKNKQLFRTRNFKHSCDLSSHRWTLDYEEDLNFTNAVYEHLYKRTEIFRMNQILALLAKEPGLSHINSGIERNKGYNLSLSKDSESV